MPVGGGQQPRPVAALAEDAVGPLEDRDPGPVGGVRVQRDVVTLDEDLHPVVQAADHQSADRGHAAVVQALALTLAEGELQKALERDFAAQAAKPPAPR